MTGDVNLKADRYFATSSARIAAEATVNGGDTAEDCDTGNRYTRLSTGWVQTSTAGVEDSVAYALKKTVVGAITYMGEARPGTAQATAAWRAQKIDTSTGTVITWADGGKFTQVATDLTVLTYV